MQLIIWQDAFKESDMGKRLQSESWSLLQSYKCYSWIDRNALNCVLTWLAENTAFPSGHCHVCKRSNDGLTYLLTWLCPTFGEFHQQIGSWEGNTARLLPMYRSAGPPAHVNPRCFPSITPLTDWLTAKLTVTPKDWKFPMLMAFLNCQSIRAMAGRRAGPLSSFCLGRDRHNRSLYFSFSKAFSAALKRHGLHT